MRTKSIVEHAFIVVGASIVLAAAAQSAQAAGPTSDQQFWDDVMKTPSPENVQASGERHQEPLTYQQSLDALAKAPSVESVQASGERHQEPMTYQDFLDSLEKSDVSS